MAQSDAERARRYRKAKRDRDQAVVTIAAVPDPDCPDGDHSDGEVAAALEVVLAGMKNPDPVLAASARRLAAALDRAANPAVAAELRRTLAELRPRTAARRGGTSGPAPGKVASLRLAHQAAKQKRAG